VCEIFIIFSGGGYSRLFRGGQGQAPSRCDGFFRTHVHYMALHRTVGNHDALSDVWAGHLVANLSSVLGGGMAGAVAGQLWIVDRERRFDIRLRAMGE
jgi:hypothetical protein